MEIFQNTIIQGIVRQGTNTERQLITLKSGELGYTTDTERLFIGNGVGSGGILVGNKFQGSYPTITGLIGVVNSIEIGDFGYSTGTNSLYSLSATNATNLSSWTKVGGVYSSGDSFIEVSSDNKITFKTNQIYVRYDGLSGNIEKYKKNLTTSTRLSTGHYRFTFPSLSSANYIPLTQIIGTDAYGYSARVISYNLSSCDVKVVNLSGGSVDANIVLSINY